MEASAKSVARAAMLLANVERWSAVGEATTRTSVDGVVAPDFVPGAASRPPRPPAARKVAARAAIIAICVGVFITARLSVSTTADRRSENLPGGRQGEHRISGRAFLSGGGRI